MSDIKKDCWIKVTSYKFFGKCIFEKVEKCDRSNFETPESSALYTVPECFRVKD